jgi:hypothetical protein
VSLALLLIAFAAIAGGVLTHVCGARRASYVAGIALGALGVASLIVSRWLNADILFVPLALAFTGACLATQAWRVARLDTRLAGEESSHRAATREGGCDG